MELREIVLSSARAIANDQSPVQHTTPVRIIGKNARGRSHDADQVKGQEERERERGSERESERESESENSKLEDEDLQGEEIPAREGEGLSVNDRGSPERGEPKRYPGYKPWPTLQECAVMSLSKTLLFTSTWLSVTAKKVK